MRDTPLLWQFYHIRQGFDSEKSRIVWLITGTEKIILFGSHAKGTARPDSDVDLLIVMPVAGSKRKMQLELRTALHDVRVPKDVIVTTPEEFAWRKDVVGTIEYPAATEGKLLYARA